MDARPLVTLLITYPHLCEYPITFPRFKEFTKIQKPLEPFNFPIEDEVDWNFRVCEVSHGLPERLLKSSMKATSTTIINDWGGGNITKITLVLLYDLDVIVRQFTTLHSSLSTAN